MEILIQELVERLQIMRSKELDLIQNSDKVNDKDIILIHAGKIMAFDKCIEEIKRMINYHKETIITKYSTLK